MPTKRRKSYGWSKKRRRPSTFPTNTVDPSNDNTPPTTHDVSGSAATVDDKSAPAVPDQCVNAANAPSCHAGEISTSASTAALDESTNATGTGTSADNATDNEPPQATVIPEDVLVQPMTNAPTDTDGHIQVGGSAADKLRQKEAEFMAVQKTLQELRRQIVGLKAAKEAHEDLNDDSKKRESLIKFCRGEAKRMDGTANKINGLVSGFLGPEAQDDDVRTVLKSRSFKEYTKAHGGGIQEQISYLQTQRQWVGELTKVGEKTFSGLLEYQAKLEEILRSCEY